MGTFEDIFKKLRVTPLTADEKAATRERLSAYMVLVPDRGAQYAASASDRLPAKYGRFGFAAFGRATGMIVLVGALASATGVSYAAEGSLPGDRLYRMKVGVNEEVRAAITMSHQKKAEMEAERAERRLAEAEQLAHMGTLTEERRLVIERNYKQHAEHARTSAQQVTDDVSAAVEARLAASLRAHKKIVAAIVSEAEEFENTAAKKTDDEAADDRRRNSEQIVALTASLEATADAHVAETNKDDATAPKKNDGKKDAAAILTARSLSAGKTINDTRAYLEAMREKLGEDAADEAEAQLVVAEGMVEDGDDMAEKGSEAEASAAYDDAQAIGYESRSLIRARGNLHLNVNFGDDENKEGQPQEVILLRY